jgi:hypothetical protein
MQIPANLKNSEALTGFSVSAEAGITGAQYRHPDQHKIYTFEKKFYRS